MHTQPVSLHFCSNSHFTPFKSLQKRPLDCWMRVTLTGCGLPKMQLPGLYPLQVSTHCPRPESAPPRNSPQLRNPLPAKNNKDSPSGEDNQSLTLQQSRSCTLWNKPSYKKKQKHMCKNCIDTYNTFSYIYSTLQEYFSTFAKDRQKKEHFSRSAWTWAQHKVRSLSYVKVKIALKIHPKINIFCKKNYYCSQEILMNKVC